MRPVRCAVFAAVCVVIAPASAHAGETIVATHRFDVDGDGKPDTIKLVSPPAISVDLASRAAAVYKPLVTVGDLRGGSITAARVAGATLIVVTAEMQVGEKRVAEAVALRYQRGKTTTLVRTPVGPQGVDGEWSKHLAATPRGLVLYQSAPRARRCDGKTAELFPQLYDVRSGKFRPTYPAVNVAGNATRIAVTTRAPADATDSVQAVAFQSTTSSTGASATMAEDVSAPREIEDGKVYTAWLAQNVAGGRGEFVTFETTMPTAVRALRVVPAPSNRLNRLVRLAVVSRGHAFVATFPRQVVGGKAYWIEFAKPLHATCLSVVIDRVARLRGKGQRTAISELTVLTDLELTAGGPDAVLAAYVAGGGSRADAAMRALRRRGNAAAGPMIREIARHAKPIERLRLRRALAALAAPAAAPDLVKGLYSPALGKQDAVLFGRALKRIGAPAVAPLAAMLATPAGSKHSRTAAVRALAHISTPAAARALAALMGKGQLAWRGLLAATAGSVRAASEGPFWLEQVRDADKAAAHKREADLWQLLRRLRERAPKALAATVDAALVARLDTSASVDATTGYQLRYRLFQAAADSTNSGVLAALQRDLSALGTTGPRADALRRITARALGNNRSAAARRILLSLAANTDPGVRRDVARALSGRADADSTSDNALTAHLRDDYWPEVRTAAAGALASRCKQPAIAARLFTAMSSDKAATVQRMAIHSLVRCRPPGLLDRLFALARNTKQSAKMRESAVGAIAQLGDRSRVGDLIALFKTHRKEAWSKAAALRLAAASAEALGRVGGTAAVATLMVAAKDDAFPEIQAGAITGLSHICPRQGMVLFRRLSLSSQRQVSLAAKRALHQCSKRP